MGDGGEVGNVRVLANLTYPLHVASANDLRRVNANHPFQAQFVHVKGRAVAVHQHHRCRKVKTTARKNPANEGKTE